MVETGEWRTLASLANVFGAEVSHHSDARFTGEKVAISNLQCSAIIWVMQHRMAVESNHIDLARRKIHIIQQSADKLGMAKR
jgi:hypothetical protein